MRAYLCRKSGGPISDTKALGYCFISGRNPAERSKGCPNLKISFSKTYTKQILKEWKREAYSRERIPQCKGAN